jgi:hypothetical protein
MENTSNVKEAAKRLSQKQKSILRSLFQFNSPLPIQFFDSEKAVVLKLQERCLIKIQNEQVFLTALGRDVLEYWENRKTNEPKPQNPSALNVARKQQRLEKSNQFLELYKQGLSYQDIGDKYEFSRERVRQILKPNPEFHEYLRERKESEDAADQKKKERAKEEFYSRTLAALYPERVTELWDYEKNSDLKPENIIAGSTSQEIWLKCPLDGYSWKKKPNDITTSWTRSGTSGCPMCAGKKKKPEKQPNLLETYPGFISQYWDYTKNLELEIYPEKLSLGSNRKAWFKCPIDGNEWQSSIASTITQQWSKGNTGCRVCNGTAQRKRGEWQRREPIAVEFPDEVAKYWLYKTNNELGLNPMKLTIGSNKEAFFKCPIDAHEWVAHLSQIKLSWKRGNSGCPACRGFVAIENTSLISTYPDYVAQYWNYEKNNELGIYPDKFTKGSQKEAWFKCPIDGYEWKTRIGSITKSSWNSGNSGCARCGSGWTLDAIRQFVASLEVHVSNLTQAELYKIFEQSGVLDTTNTDGLKIVKDIIKGKLFGQKLRDIIQGKKVKFSEAEIDSNADLKSDAELQGVST